MQQFFLDIACFFKGEDKDYVLQIVSNSKNKVSLDCIEVLIEKAMITIDYGGIQMHDLLEKLGKDIVHEESPNDPGKRSRLWFYEDVEQVLMESTGTRNIKGIMVKLPDPAEITLNPECFRNMMSVTIFATQFSRKSSCCVQYASQFATTLRLKSLEVLDLGDCEKLESFPEIEVEMESLWRLNMEGSGIRELHPSIAYLTGLRELNLYGCFNLTRFATLRLKSLEVLDLGACEKLESFPEIEVEMESLDTLNISGSGVRELPSSIAYLTGIYHFKANYCENLTCQKVNSQVSSSNSELPLLPNLSKSDSLLPPDCWYTLRELDLSGNNFINLPRCFSKFVNLLSLDLSYCKSLLEIPEQVLPRRVEFVSLDNCTSLVKIPMAWVLLDNCTSLEKFQEISLADYLQLSLTNCVRLRSYDITENIFLNQVSVSSPHSDFNIILPGDEVPKWFSCCKDATIVRKYLSGTKRYDAGCEVSFEIPPNLKWGTLRLVLCAVTPGIAKILLNGKLVNERDFGLLESHVYLTSIPLLKRYAYEFEEPLTKQGDTCQVILDLSGKVPAPVKIPCGVHLLGHQVADVSETDVVDHGPTQLLLPDAMAVDDDIYDDQHQDCELLSLSLASKTSLGKRPRQSDYMALHDDHRANVVDIGDHGAQWLALFTGPADHQKRSQSNEAPKWFM
ncbi:TMV resistance protein N-like [Prunus avium]|uniref:TMV resistance protein N-like n=1 Tax=Prunus avium TaxID=42229 RepID=A0A6P5RD78_PRUAV|nr:TMV resistance protein N-like [Prunus avium]